MKMRTGGNKMEIDRVICVVCKKEEAVLIAKTISHRGKLNEPMCYLCSNNKTIEQVKRRYRKISKEIEKTYVDSQRWPKDRTIFVGYRNRLLDEKKELEAELNRIIKHEQTFMIRERSK